MSKFHKRYSLVAHLLIFLQIVCPTYLFALPTDGQVVGGDAVIQQPSPNELVIQQSSDKTIVNWQDFSIQSHEGVEFKQPSTSSTALNRVQGSKVSEILGRLSANGNVFLINPNGIIFGQSSRVDVNGLVASTSDIHDDDFMAGRFNFNIPSPKNAFVINKGQITAADAGLVALVAPGVDNSGIIQAKLGKVTLASGDVFTVDLYGDELIQMEVDSEVAQQVIGPDGTPLEALVNNSGEIYAEAGTVILEAQAARGIVDRVINNDGIIEVQSIDNDNGVIVLRGGDEGEVRVAGTLDASGLDEGEEGGTIHILGNEVNLDGAQVNASGDAGGGTVLVGGDRQGQNPNIQNAQNTTVSESSSIQANAINKGDGGKIIVWSENSTKVYASLSATGGLTAGDGGFIETSGKKFLDVTKAPIVSATNGKAGTWLLDPTNIEIVSGPGNGDGSQVSATTIETALNAGTSVHIITSGQGLEKGTITVSTAILKSSGGDTSLTLTAHGDIVINDTITSTNGTLDVNLIAGADIFVNAAISTNGGLVMADAGSIDLPANISGAYMPAARICGSNGTLPKIEINADITTNGGAVSLGQFKTKQHSLIGGGTYTKDKHAVTDVTLQTASINTGGGDFTINGSAILVASTATITSPGGNIAIEGGDKTLVFIAGILNAANLMAGQVGGSIHVLGYQVGLFDSAVLDASGDAGGGTILIGGDFQGKNDAIRNAYQTYIGTNAIVSADAIKTGNGGKVIVWADDVTRFYGTINARGGATSGNGGFVEVSGKENLAFRGDVQIGAANGQGGTLLLDPNTLTIQNTAGTENDLVGTTGNDANATTLAFGEFDTDAATIQNTVINALLAVDGNTVILQADLDITINSDAAISNTGGGDLTLQAGRDIFVNGAITLGGDGILTLSAADAGSPSTSTTGQIVLAATGDLTTATGNINLTAGTGNDAIQWNGANATTTTGAVLVNSSLQTGGNVTIDTEGGAVTLSAVRIQNQVNIDTTNNSAAGANVTINGTFLGTTSTANAKVINLNAGTSNVLLNGSLGTSTSDTTRVGAVTLTGANINMAGTNIFSRDRTININGQINLSVGAVTINNHSQSSASANINLDTIDGAQALTISASGTSTANLDGNIGGTTALTSLNVVRRSTLSGITVNTAGGTISFGNVVTLDTGAVTVDATNGGGSAVGADITFSSTVNGAQALTLNSGTGGTLNINSTIGNSTALTGLSLTSGQAITQSAAWISSGTASFTTNVASRNITLSDTGNNFSGTVDLNTTGTGAATINNGANDITLGASTVGGAIDITAGSITVSGAMAGSGAITLDANGTNADVNLNAALTAGAGSAVTITADDSIIAAAAGDITASGAGTLSVTANTNTSNGDSTDFIDMADGTLWDAGSGTISVTTTGANSGAIFIGGLLTTNATATAVTVATDPSTADSIINDAGDVHVDIVAANGGLVIDGRGIGNGGVDNTLETTIDSLDLDNLNSGNARITETDAITITKVNMTSAGGTFFLTAGGTITVSGAITFDAGGTTLLANGQNSDVLINATISNSGSGGGLNLTAADSIIFAAAGDVTIDIAANNLNITANNDNLTGDSGNVITMDNDTLISATAGTIQLISTGLNAGSITLGGVTNITGDITVNSADAIIDGGVTHVDAVATSGTITLTGGSGIGSAGSIDVNTATLVVDSNQSILVNSATTLTDLTITLNPITTADTYTITDGGNLTLSLTDSGTDIDIGGISLSAGNLNLTLTQDTGNLTTSGAININSGNFSVTTTDGSQTYSNTIAANNVTLNADGTNSDVNLNAAITTASGGAVTITADDSVTTDANGDITMSGSVALSVTANTDNANGDTGDLITMTDGALWNAGSGTISITYNGFDAGNFTVGGLLTTNATASAITITSTSGAAVGDGGNTHVDFVAASGGLVADINSGFGSPGANSIETTLASVDIDIATNGGIRITETDAISITKLDNSSTTNPIVVSAGGTITLTSGQSGVASGTADIILTATGTNSDIILNAAITTTAGAVTLTADDSITADANGDITMSGTAALSVTANNNTSNGDTGDLISMTDGALWDAGGGTITLQSTGANAGDITLGGLLTTNATASAITVTADTAIVDGGVTHVDAVASSGTVNLIGLTGIGSAGSIDITTAALVVDSNQSILVNSSTTLTDLTITLDPGSTADTYTITDGGNLTLSLTDSGTDINIGGISLAAGDMNFSLTQDTGNLTTSGNVDLGTAGGGNFSITTTTGSQTYTNDVDDVNNITLNADGQNSDVTFNSSDQWTTINGGVVTITADDSAIFMGGGSIVGFNSGAFSVTSNTATTVGDSGNVIFMANDGTALQGGTGLLSLTSTGANAGNITVGNLVTVGSQSNAITVTAGNGNAVVDGNGATQNFATSTGGVVIDSINGVGTSGDALELNAASVDVDNTGTGGIFLDDISGGLNIVNLNSSSANGDITVSAAGTINITVDGAIAAGSGNVSITASAGSIEDTAGTGNAKITTTGTISLTASAGVGQSAVLEIASSSNLTVNANQSIQVASSTTLTDLTLTLDPGSTADTYTITDGGNLTLGLTDSGTATNIGGISLAAGNLNFTLTTDTGALTTSGAIDINSGNFSVTTTDGSQTYSNTIDANNVTLNADGQNSDVNLQSTITTVSGGAVTITADDSVIATATGDITSSGAGALSVTANTATTDGDSNDLITMADGTLWDAGSGTITLVTTGTNSTDITLGGLLTTNATATAVTVTADSTTSGQIIDAGDTHVDIVAASGGLVIDGSNIGPSSNFIETTVDSIDLDNTSTGNVFISETDAITVTKYNQTAGSGTLRLDAAGTITINGAVTWNAGGVQINATGQNSDILVNTALSNSGSGGNVTIRADDSVIFGGAGDITADSLSVSIIANNDNLTGDSGNVIAMNNDTLINATAGTISLTSTGANAGSITLGGLTTTNATASAISVNSAAAIIDGGDTHVDAVATSGTITLTGSSGIGSAGSIDVNTAALVVDSNGDILVNSSTTLTDLTITLEPGSAAETYTITDGGNLTLTLTDSGTDLDIGGISLSAGNLNFTLTTDTGALTTSGNIDINSGNFSVTTTSGSQTYSNTIDANDVTLNADGQNSDVNLNNTITTVSGGAVTITADDSVTFSVNGDISNSGAGNTSITANTATTNGDSNDVIFMASGAEFAAGTGTITLTSTGANAGDITVGRIVTNNATNTAITITAGLGAVLDGNTTAQNAVAASGRVVIDAATGVGTSGELLELTAGSVDVDNTTSGGIFLAELDGIDIINLNSSSANGDITFSAAGTINITADAAIAAGSGNVSITASAGSIEDTAATANAKITTTGTISLTASAGVGQSAVLEIASSSNLTVNANQSIQVASSTTLTDLTLTLDPGSTADTYTITDGGNLTLSLTDSGTATNIGGISLSAGNLNFTLTTDTGALTTSGAININSGNFSVTTTDGSQTYSNTIAANDVTLNVDGTNSDLTINNTITTASGGSVTLTADDSITFAAGGDITASGAGNVSITANTNNAAGDSFNAIDMADGTVINAGSGTIALTSSGINAGSLDVTGLTTTNATNVAITLTTNSSISDAGNTNVDVVAASGRIVMTANVGIGSGAALEITANSLDVSNTVSNNIALTETDAISVVQLSNTASGGTVSLTSSTGTITVASGGSGVTSTNGALSLTATGTNSDILINAAISSGTGSVTLVADDSIIADANGDITMTGSAALSVTANNNNSNGDTGDLITMADGALWDAGSGTIALTATSANAGDIMIGGLLTTNATASAVTVTSDAAIFDGGSAHVDVVAGSGTINLIGLDGMGTGGNGAIEVTTAALVVDSNQSIQVASSTTLTDLTMTVDPGTTADTHAITDGGNLTLTLTDSGADLNIGGISLAAGNLNFTLTTDTGNLTTSGAIDINSGNFSVTTTAGSQTYSNTIAANNVTLNADGTNSDVNINNTITTASGGAVTITADDSVTANATGDITASGAGAISVTANTNTSDGDSADLISMADGALWNAGSGTISLITTGANSTSITLGGLLTTNATTSAITVFTGIGSIIDGGDTHVDIVAASGRLVIDGHGIGPAANSIETTLDSIDLDNTVTGNVDIAETDAITIIKLNQGTATGGNTLTAGGTITIAAGGSGVTSTAGAGGITLTATGTNSDIIINAALASGTGLITLTADDSIIADANGDITMTGTAALSVTANNNISNGDDGDVITMADGALWDAGSGTTTLTSTGANSGTITLGGLTTANATASAITVTADTAIVDGGVTHVDAVAASGTVNLIGLTGIGSAGSIDVNTAALVVDSNQSILVNSSTTLTSLTMMVDPGSTADTYTFTDGGNLTLSLTDSGTDLDIGGISLAAGNLNFTLTQDTGNLTNSGNIDINSGNFSVTTTAGNQIYSNTIDANNVTLTADSGLTINNTITALGNLTLEGDSDNAADTGDAITVAAGLTLSAAGSMTLDATTGGITLNSTTLVTSGGVITLNDNVTLATGAVSIDTTNSGGTAAGANINLVSTINGAQALTLNVGTGGTLTLGGDLGTTTALGGLTVTHTQALTLSGRTIETAAGAVSFSGPITLASGAVSIDTTDGGASAGGNNVTFSSTINGAQALTVNSGTGGTINVVGAIGNTTALTGLILTTGNAITQSAAWISSGTVSLTTNSGNSAITLNNTGNSFSGTVSLNTSGSGNATLDNGTASIDLATSTVGGNLAVTTGGTIDDSGVLTVTGTSAFTTDVNNQAITLNTTTNQFGGAVTLTTQGTTANVTIDGGTTALAIQGNVAGDLAVTAGAAITDSAALTVSGTSSFTVDAGSNNITLGTANLTGAISVSTTGTSDFTLDNTTTNVNLGTVGVTGNLSVTTGGTIIDSGVLTITGTSAFVTDVNNQTIALDTTTNQFGSAVTLTTQGTTANVTIDGGTTALAIQGNVAGNLAVITGAAITDSAALTVSGTSSFTVDAGSNNITLGTANLTGAVSVSTTGTSDFTLDNTTTNVNLGTVGATGNLSVTTGGTIIDSGVLTVTGTSAFVTDVNNQTITLDSTTNQFGGAVTLTTQGTTANVTIDGGTTALAIQGNVAGNLVVTAGAAITDSAALTVSGTSAFTTDVNNQAITLNTTTNQFGGAVTLTTQGTTANVTIDGGTTALAIQGNVAGNLAVIAGAAITDSAALTVSGTSSFTVDAGSNNITLGTANLTGAISVSTTGTSDFTLDNTTTNVNLGTVGVTGNLSVTTGGTVIDSGVLSVTGTSAFTTDVNNQTITLDSTTNQFGSAVTLTTQGTTANVTIDGGTTALAIQGNVAGDLAVTAGAAITDSAALTVSGTSSFTVDAGSNNITLGTANLTGAISVNTTGTSDFNLDNTTTNVNLGTVGVTGNLSVTTGGTIIDSGVLTITGTSAFVTDVNNQTITLDSTTNQFGGAVTLTTQGTTANVTIDGGTTALAIQGNVAGDLAVIAGAAITDSATLTVSGTSSFTVDAGSNNITLGTANLTGAISVSTTGTSDFTLDNTTTNVNLGTVGVTGNLSVTTGGTIIDSGVLTVTGTSAFTTDVNNQTIILNSTTNQFGGAVTLTTQGTTANVTIDGGTTALAIQGNVAGGLTVTAGAAITDSGALAVSGTANFTIDAGSNNITLDTASLASVILVSTTGTSDFTLDNTNTNVDLNAITVTGNLSVTTGGVITNSDALTITGTSTFTTDVNNQSITLNTTANQFGGAVTLNTQGTTADVTIDGGTTALAIQGNVAGNLAVIAGAAVTDSAALTVSGTSSFTIDAGSNNITLGTANLTGAITVSTTGTSDFTLDNTTTDVNLGTVGVTGNLSVTTGGTIIDSGVLSVTGTSAFTTDVNNRSITLDTTTNQFGSAVTVATQGTTANVTIDGGTTALGLQGNVAGNLAVIAGAAITDSGVLTVSGTSSFTIDNGSNNITLGTANLAGPISVGTTGTSDFTLDNTTTNINFGTVGVTGNLSATTGGTIRDTGVLTVAGTADFITDVDDRSITLNSANTIGGAITFTTQTSGANGANIVLNNGNTAINLAAFTTEGNLTLQTTAAIALAGHTVNGNLSVTSGNAITQTAALTVSGTSTFTTNTLNKAITLSTATNALTGAVAFNTLGTTGNVVLDNGSTNLEMAASTVRGNFTTTTTGNLLVSGDQISNGVVSLTSGADINVNAKINTGIGNIILSAVNDVVFTALGDVTSVSGDVTITADSDNGGVASGALTMTVGTVINAGAGKIALNADEDITLGKLTTTNSTLTAVTLTSTEGGIVEGGVIGTCGGGISAGCNIVSSDGRLVVDAVTGIGDAGIINGSGVIVTQGAIKVDTQSVDIDNTTSGDINLFERGTTNILKVNQAGPGNLTISFDGAPGATLTGENNATVAGGTKRLINRVPPPAVVGASAGPGSGPGPGSSGPIGPVVPPGLKTRFDINGSSTRAEILTLIRGGERVTTSDVSKSQLLGREIQDLVEFSGSNSGKTMTEAVVEEAVLSNNRFKNSSATSSTNASTQSANTVQDAALDNGASGAVVVNPFEVQFDIVEINESETQP
jgi:hypothetical protein